jgi:ribonuclease Z
MVVIDGYIGIVAPGRLRMKGYVIVVAALFAGAWLTTSGSIADAAPCLMVTLTGTQGGPQSFNGLAGAGTLEWR